MSQPGLHVLLEVEFLERVELTSATSHHVRVSRDRVSHVEVVNVLDEGGAVHLGVTCVDLVGKLLEARSFDHIEAEEMRAELGKTSTELINGIVRQRAAKLLGDSTHDHPVILREARAGKGSASSLRTAISVDKSANLLKVRSGRKNQISIVGTLVTSVALIDHESVFRDLLVTEVVSAEQVDDLGGRKTLGNLRGDTKLKSANTAEIIMKDVETVPLLFLVDQVSTLLELVNVVHDSLGVRSLESQ